MFHCLGRIMPNRTTHRIYVVEDNQLLSEAYAFMLQAHDFVTECFITGGSFLASRWQPENAALLLDLCLPDMGGLEILAAVRMQAPRLRRARNPYRPAPGSAGCSRCCPNRRWTCRS